MPRGQSVVTVVPGSPEPDVLCCQALCSGKGVGNVCVPSLTCLSEDRHWDGWGGEGPGMFNVLDIHLVQHSPGPGSYCKSDPVLAKDFHWAWRWCWRCCAGARFLGRWTWRKTRGRGMCGTATNTASVEAGGSGSGATTLPKALNCLKYSPTRKGSK